MDVMLIIIAAAIFFMTIVMNGVVMIHFSDEQDKNQAWLPKLVVMFGLCLACFGVLLLPMDVANRNSAFAAAVSSASGMWGGEQGEALPMTGLWEIVLVAIVIMVLGVIPFAIFYYEESGEGIMTQLKRGLTYGLVTLITGSVIIVIIKALTHGEAQIPMKAYTATIGGHSDLVGAQTYTTIPVTLPIYAVACVSLVGWVFFAMFAGVGLVALPIDLIHTFTDRPTSIDVKNWAAKRNELKERAAKLRQIGQKMEQENFTTAKLTRHDQKLFNKFKNAVYLLEKDYEILRVRKFEKGGNILYFIGMGIMGVIGVFISLLWVVHTVLFVFMHNAHPFLNTLLVGLDNVFPLFGTVGFGTFAFYLLWCTIKGVMKMGLRLAFFTIHPMEPGKTMMNSFLFNVGIILLCEIPVIQFCSSAFSIYARVTSVSMLFGTQIRYIKYFDIMFQYNVFLYIMFAFIALTSLYMAVKKPKDNGKEIEKAIAEELELKGTYIS